MKKKLKNILPKNGNKNGLSILIGSVILAFGFGTLVSCSTVKENTETSSKRPETEETEGTFELTEQGKAFLEQICRTLYKNDFDSQTTKGEEFWHDFLFYSYTGVPDGAETEQIHREDLGFDETVVKVSLQDAETYAKLVFGIDLPDIKPSYEDMKEGETSCFYRDGYYYIGVSDFPNYGYSFADYEESNNTITVRYTIAFEDESNYGEVTLTLEPEANKNGFIITSKTTKYFDR